MTPMFENYREIIPDFSAFQESLRRPLPTHRRVNRIKIQPSAFAEIMEAQGIGLARSSDQDDSLLLASNLKAPGRLLEYFLGYYHPQALTSCLVSLALSVRADSFALDMCASPGGKTSHLAQRMENGGLVVANELYAQRRIPLSHTLARLGVLNTVITGYQAQEFPLRQRFDRVLADVPCSGEGRFRWNSEFSRYEEKGGRVRLRDLQKRVILRAFDLLKDDGEMVYATCTYNPEENEAIVNALLNERDAEVLPIHVGCRPEPGVAAWGRETYDRRVRRCVRFYPHRVDSVGFFMARIGRG